MACITHRVYHRIELEQGFPKPVAKVSENFRTRFLFPLENRLISLRLPRKNRRIFDGIFTICTKTADKIGTWWYRYRLQVSSRFPRFSSAHKNLVRKVQALLRPVLESPAHRLYDGIPCWLVSSSLLVKYFIIKKMKITIHFVWQRFRAGRAQGIRTFQSKKLKKKSGSYNRCRIEFCTDCMIQNFDFTVKISK